MHREGTETLTVHFKDVHILNDCNLHGVNQIWMNNSGFYPTFMISQLPLGDMVKYFLYVYRPHNIEDDWYNSQDMDQLDSSSNCEAENSLTAEGWY